MAQRDNVAQAIGLKVGRVGGLTKARVMRDFYVATGIKMNIEGTSSSKISDMAVVHLALSTPAEFDRVAWDSNQHHSIITAEVGYTKRSGRATVTDRPGLGIELLLEVLGETVAIYHGRRAKLNHNFLLSLGSWATIMIKYKDEYRIRVYL